MARVGRLAGALLVEAGGETWLVGNTKEPCDWSAHGFETPPEMDATKRPWIRLQRSGDVDLAEPHLVIDMDGEALARELARRMLIERNGSVSERLWRLVAGIEDGREVPARISAQWLVDVPEAVWHVVRDAVLRCL
jgi:hypothetical protein